MFFLSALTAIVVVCFAGGPLFIVAAAILGIVYYNGELIGQSTYSPFINHLRCSCEGKDLMNYIQSPLS